MTVSVPVPELREGRRIFPASAVCWRHLGKPFQPMSACPCRSRGHYSIGLFADQGGSRVEGEPRVACPRHPTGCWRGCPNTYETVYVGDTVYRLLPEETRARFARLARREIERERLLKAAGL